MSSYSSGQTVPTAGQYIETDSQGNEISNTEITCKAGDTFPPTSGGGNKWKSK